MTTTPRNQEISVITFKTIRTAAACGLTLLGASIAHAQDSSTGSTDIYRNEFPKSFTIDPALQMHPHAPIVTASTDIWTTDFQKAFETDKSLHLTRDMAAKTGSTDIWSTNFQKAFM
jgi:hypothetical protein